MDEPVEILLEKNEENKQLCENYADKEIKILFNIDVALFFLFTVRIIINIQINELAIWYISSFYIIVMSVFICNLYIKKYVHQTLIANAVVFTMLITEGFISIIFSLSHKEISSFVLSSLSIFFGIFGCYFSKKYFSKN